MNVQVWKKAFVVHRSTICVAVRNCREMLESIATSRHSSFTMAYSNYNQCNNESCSKTVFNFQFPTVLVSCFCLSFPTLGEYSKLRYFVFTLQQSIWKVIENPDLRRLNIFSHIKRGKLRNIRKIPVSRSYSQALMFKIKTVWAISSQVRPVLAAPPSWHWMPTLDQKGRRIQVKCEGQHTQRMFLYSCSVYFQKETVFVHNSDSIHTHIYLTKFTYCTGTIAFIGKSAVLSGLHTFRCQTWYLTRWKNSPPRRLG